MSTVIVGESVRGNSAVVYLRVNQEMYISHNSTSFWISGAFLGQDLVVFKGTKAGKHIAGFGDRVHRLQIAAEELHAGLAGLAEFIEDLFVKNAEPKSLREAIKAAIEQAHDEGSEERAQRIRVSLGLEPSYTQDLRLLE